MTEAALFDAVGPLNRSLAHRDPASFAYTASQGRWQRADHLAMISREMVRLRDRPIRLIVTMPPRHGKTVLISRNAPAWFLGNWPEKKVILASYGDTYARHQGRAARDLLLANTDLFHSGVRVRRDVTAADSWLTEQGGGMETAGVGGAVTGKGADLLIIDDPIKDHQEANSELIRDKQWDWFTSTAYSRLEPGGSVVILLTRWHEDDLVGRILADPDIAPDWTILRLAALVEEDDLPDPLGRGVGDALWPERFDSEALQSIKRYQPTYWWNALYQGRPAPAEGNIFKRDNMRYWRPYIPDPAKPEEILYDLGGGKFIDPKACTRFGIMDLATTEKQESDFTVVGMFDIDPSGLMICVSLIRKRIEGPDLLPLLKQQYATWQPELMGVESAGFGIAIIQQARRDGLPIIELKAEKDKLSRALTASAMHESHFIWFEQGAAYLDALVPELLSFNKGTYDDQVDVIAYGAIEAKKRMFDWMSVYAPEKKEIGTVATSEAVETWGAAYGNAA